MQSYFKCHLSETRLNFYFNFLHSTADSILIHFRNAWIKLIWEKTFFGLKLWKNMVGSHHNWFWGNTSTSSSTRYYSQLTVSILFKSCFNCKNRCSCQKWWKRKRLQYLARKQAKYHTDKQMSWNRWDQEVAQHDPYKDVLFELVSSVGGLCCELSPLCSFTNLLNQ